VLVGGMLQYSERTPQAPGINPSWEAGWAMGTYIVQDATYEEIYIQHIRHP
jgi:hypothetical protein